MSTISTKSKHEELHESSKNTNPARAASSTSSAELIPKCNQDKATAYRKSAIAVRKALQSHRIDYVEEQLVQRILLLTWDLLRDQAFIPIQKHISEALGINAKQVGYGLDWLELHNVISVEDSHYYSVRPPGEWSADPSKKQIEFFKRGRPCGKRNTLPEKVLRKGKLLSRFTEPEQSRASKAEQSLERLNPQPEFPLFDPTLEKALQENFLHSEGGHRPPSQAARPPGSGPQKPKGGHGPPLGVTYNNHEVVHDGNIMIHDKAGVEKTYEVGALGRKTLGEIMQEVWAAAPDLKPKYVEDWHRRIKCENPRLVWSLACDLRQRPHIQHRAGYLNTSYLNGMNIVPKS